MEHFIQTSGDSMNQGIGTLSFQKIGGEGGVGGEGGGHMMFLIKGEDLRMGGRNI